MKQKVIGYVRVSTSSQAIEGISLDNQIVKLKSYCDLNDLELVSIVKDEGLSAKNLSGRPQAQAMLKQAIRQKRGIVVYKLDRMFRNTVDALTTIQQLDKAGVTFHSINEKLDTSSAMGKFFTTMLAALAELERNVVSERTRDALQNKKAQGLRIGTVPFGYSLADDSASLILNPAEQGLLSEMKRLRKRGMSFQKIAARLNSNGFQTRNGGSFHRQSIHKILKNSTRHHSVLKAAVNF